MTSKSWGHAGKGFSPWEPVACCVTPGEILSLPVRRYIHLFNEDYLGTSHHREGREGFLEEGEALGTLRRNMGAAWSLGQQATLQKDLPRGWTLTHSGVGPESLVRAPPLPRAPHLPALWRTRSWTQ